MSKKIENIQTTSCKNGVNDSCLPIHATNEDNTYTFCGLKVTPEMSFHRGGVMLGMIISGKEFACNDCLSIDTNG